MKYIPSIFAATIIAFGSFLFIASAQNYETLAPLPGTTISEGAKTTDMGTYLAGAIKLLLAIGASIAILMTVIGGTHYVAAGISPDAKSNAKKMIADAFIGLSLMLVSYLILNSINPKLVQFNLSLKEAKVKVTDLTPLDVGLDKVYGENSFVVAGVKATNQVTEAIKNCSLNSKITAFEIGLSTPAAIQMEANNGSRPIWNPPIEDATIKANLIKLKTEVDKLQAALATARKGTATITSAYRPLEYQRHLFFLWRAWELEGLKDLDTGAGMYPECFIAKNAIGLDYRGHFPSGTSVVANPDGGSAPHTLGRGVDIKLSDDSLYSEGANGINSFMTKNNIGLKWQNINGDKWHFNLNI